MTMLKDLDVSTKFEMMQNSYEMFSGNDENDFGAIDEAYMNAKAVLTGDLFRRDEMIIDLPMLEIIEYGNGKETRYYC